jgi:hypothetical protein
MADTRFTVNVTPAQFQQVRELALTLDIFPERKADILDILTEAWSENGGYFIPAIARDKVIEEIKLVVVNQ